MKNYKDLDLWLEIEDLLSKGKDVYFVDKEFAIIQKINDCRVTVFYEIKNHDNSDNRFSFFTVESEEEK